MLIKKVHHHIKRHHRKYLLGVFGSFAVVKTVLLLAGFVGLMHMTHTFAGLNPEICEDVYDIPQSECEALVTFYNATNGANWTYNNNWGDIDGGICGKRYGIGCTEGYNGYVNEIILSENNLMGYIPTEMNNLTNLEYLDIHTNQIISIENGAFDGLSSLTYLRLNYNQIISIENGAFDDLNDLEYLYISYNCLDTGSLDQGIIDLADDTEGSEWQDYEYVCAQIIYDPATSTPGPVTGTLILTGGNPTNRDTINDENPDLSAYTYVWDGNYAYGIDISGLSDENDLLHSSNIEYDILTGIVTWIEGTQGVCNGVTEIPESECEALVALYNATNGDDWDDNSGWGDIENGICDENRYGIICDDNHVYTIELSSNNLVGYIPIQLSNITGLYYLSFSDNQIINIESGAFNGLDNLESLYFDYNQIESIEIGTFSGLSNLTELDLTNNLITDIESGVFDGLSALTYLNLGYNQIESIEIGTFSGLSNLTELDLTNNLITDIESGVFDGLSALTYLNLGYNQITSIESGNFNGLDNLEFLYLDYNQIESIEILTFNGLSALTQLNLNNNLITDIESGVFAGLSSLTDLEIHENNIANIKNGVFNGLSALTKLELFTNEITSIESGAFNGLSALTKLDLTFNQFTGIKNGDFNGLSALTILYLDDNQIASIESGSFNGLSVLTGLYLNNNDIINIEGGIFHGLSSLTNLQLNSNPIINLKNNGFIGLSSLHKLDLSTHLINNIESGAFNGLFSLTGLYLYNNQISNIESGAFNGLSALTQLYLYNNQLTSIENGTFNGLSALTQLHLYNNQLTSIENGTFNGLSALTQLYLYNNQISNIESGAFNGLSALTDLRIYNNQLISIENGTFNGLSALTQLYLYNNQISNIKSGAFNGLSALTDLRIYNNQLISIENGTFNGLSDLTQLYLYNNQISNIENGTFNGLSDLTYLRLDYNQIESIENGTFSGLFALAYLNLKDNQITSIESGTFLSGNGFSELNNLYLTNNCSTSGAINIPFKVSSNASTNNNNCALITGTDAQGFIRNLTGRTYSLAGSYYSGNKAISFNYPSIDNVFLAPVIMQSTNPNGYTGAYYANKVRVQYESGTEITYNSAAFSGILHSPELFSTGSVPGMTGVVAITRFGYLLDSVEFSQPITIRIPALGKEVDDEVGIYSSDAESIYSEDPDWNFEQTGIVTNLGGKPYVEFTTDHASWFILGETEEGEEETNLKTYFDGYEDSSSGSWLDIMFNQFDFGDAWKSIIDLGTAYDLIINIKNTLGRPTTTTDAIPIPGGFRYHPQASIANDEETSVQLKVKYFNK